jgi:periplasmic divalent cation tolerance protein
MILIYTTCKNTDEAREMATKLLSEKVAAGVDIFPIYSIHRDSGQVKGINAAAMIVKTEERKIQQVNDVLRQTNTEFEPRVVSFKPFRINQEFKEWVTTSVA